MHVAGLTRQLPLCPISDTLMIGAFIIAPEFIVSVLFSNIPAGGMVCVYVAALPIVLISTIGGDTVMRMGFGVSLPIAAVIFAAAVIAKWRYIRSNVKINGAVINYEAR